MKIRCTNCGADLPIEKESDFISCEFCGAALFVDSASTITSYYMKPEIRSDDLSAIVVRKLDAMDIPPVHDIKHVEMVFYPFWRFDTGGEKVLLVSAIDAPAFEMTELYSPGGRPISFNPSAARDHRVMAPTTLYLEAKQRFESAWAEHHPTEETRALKTLIVSLVYLPIYDMTYEATGKSYRVYIEGVWGNVFADSWPPNSEKRKNLLLGGVGISTLTAFFLEALLVPTSLLLVAIYGATALTAYYVSRYTLEHLKDRGDR